LAEALVSRGHDVHVVGYYDQANPSDETQSGVRVVRLSSRSGRLGPWVNRVRLHRTLKQIANAGAIDILEAPDFEGPSAFLPRCSRARVVRLHGSHRYFSDERRTPHSRSVAFFERRALFEADAVVSVSAYTAQRTRALFALRREIPVIHNAVSIPAAVVRKDEYRTLGRIVYFGTLAEKKGVLPLAEAWRQFHAEFPEWQLVLLGRDAIYQGRSVKAMMIERMGEAAKAAEFTGAVDHDTILQRLPNFDFTVLPSYSEAFALAPMEAMALGVPVVVSNMSSGPELVDNGVDGWLCDPRDPQTILGAMRRAALDPALREHVAGNARRKVEAVFSYEAFIDRNILFYEGLLAEQEALR
jgi:glycosyltransferase involved in cell wall biosynthesis